MNQLLLFGATGAIGTATRNFFKKNGWRVTGVSRVKTLNESDIVWAPFDASEDNKIISEKLRQNGPFDAVCWAQGANCTDSIYSFDVNQHQALYEANVLFVLSTLKTLLEEDVLEKPSRLCIVSSIWQNRARQTKLSYCVTKSALKGVVLSLATDFAIDGHLINAVLPGVLETPMTQANLSPDQIAFVTEQTKFGRLPTLDDVSSAIYSLCSVENTGVTGQFVEVDLGFSNVRVI
ncbi:SDR family oxidoreductase [Arenicellales bacterium nBUS_45]